MTIATKSSDRVLSPLLMLSHASALNTLKSPVSILRNSICKRGVSWSKGYRHLDRYGGDVMCWERGLGGVCEIGGARRDGWDGFR